MINVLVLHLCHNELLLFCSEHGRDKVVCSTIPHVFAIDRLVERVSTVLKLSSTVCLPSIVQTAAAQCVLTLLN